MHDLEQTDMLQPLVNEIETTVSNAKKELAEKVNSVMTETYWTIGKYIVEFEQSGNEKAIYGKIFRKNMILIPLLCHGKTVA